MPLGVEITNSGVRYKGGWDDICEFADYLSDVIPEYMSDQEELPDYDDWKPEEEECEEDLSRKTAEEACMEKREMEKDFNGTKEELGDAGSHVLDSLEHMANGKDPRGKIKRASKKIGKTMGAKSFESLRGLEKQIYDKIMLQANPYYFDAEFFSINLKNSKEGEMYILTLNIPDETLREDLQARIKGDY